MGSLRDTKAVICSGLCELLRQAGRFPAEEEIDCLPAVAVVKSCVGASIISRKLLSIYLLITVSKPGKVVLYLFDI
ncbi:hypothetical protein BHC53_00015 [Snodgrassella alvi]|nr:hypothetical protein BHC53_00015 [Snodgrassella alvi]